MGIAKKLDIKKPPCVHRRGRKTGQIKICHMCLPTPVLSGSGDEGQKSGRIFSLSNRSPGNVIKFWLQFTAYDSQVEGACQAFFEAAAPWPAAL